jgi:hypothetical protein
MRRTRLIVTATLALCGGISGAQTVPDPGQHSSAPSDSTLVGEGLKDLDAMTFACPRAALDAAAREAAKVHSLGTYQFAYFSILNASHHAQYEVHFQSNYEGEPDLKYCVVLYCQQGWDPAQSPAVTLMNPAAGSTAVRSSLETCAVPHHATHTPARNKPTSAK